MPGRFAIARLNFLREHHPDELSQLQQDDALDAHLEEIEETANTMRDQLVANETRQALKPGMTDEEREAVFRYAIVMADSEVMRELVLTL